MMRLFISILIALVSIIDFECLAFEKYVTVDLNLRRGPGTNYSVIAVIPRGTMVTIDEDCDCKWVPVEYKGLIGYISTKYLSSEAAISSHQESSSQPISITERVRYYTNTDEDRIQSPTHYSSIPAGATALCRDGTYSFSRNRRGTCSHHGGVAKWLIPQND